MSLQETYMRNVENVKKANPGAEFIDVTRSAGSTLAPSWETLNAYKEGRITWDDYIRRYVKEMSNKASNDKMRKIGDLSKTKDVYLVCFERKGNCHRFILKDMIDMMMRGA